MLEFMRKYTLKNPDGVFSYPAEWAGFNIPGPTIEKMFALGIDDFNYYDNIIYSIHNKINKKKYYLIASSGEDVSTTEHELCHAFYFLDSKYRKAANELVNNLPINIFNKIKKKLIGMGYCDKVIKDEIQAYLSTGHEDVLRIRISNKTLKEFKTLFGKYKHKKNVTI